MVFCIPELFYISPLLCSQTQGIPQVWSTVTEPSAEGKNEGCPLFTVMDYLENNRLSWTSYCSFLPYPTDWEPVPHGCVLNFALLILGLARGWVGELWFKFWLLKYMLLREIHYIKFCFRWNKYFVPALLDEELVRW